MVRRPLRTALRFSRFLAFSYTSVRDFNRSVRPHEVDGIDPRRRAEWTHRHARRLCRILNCQVDTVGTPPPAAIYAANHLGYLDIVTLAASTPVIFISKAEVQSWPILGTLASCGGTLFLQRERKEELREVATRFDPIIASGIPVAMFLEGTSTGGGEVLPFKPGLLAPAVTRGWNVAPVGMNYDVSSGNVAADVAYWRDDTFLPHFLKLLSQDWIRARVSFGEAQPAGSDRKALAGELHRRVVELRQTTGSPKINA